MRKTKDVAERLPLPDLPRLRALAEGKPDTAMATVRAARPLIEAALSSGHSLKHVCECLNEDGLTIGYKSLSTCLSRLRREKTSGSSQVWRAGLAIPVPPGPTSARTPNTAPHPPTPRHPMANYLEHDSGKLPGFHFTGEPPDPEKLF